MPILTAENVAKDFPTRSQPLTVLREVSLQLEGNECLAIQGPSGSGKSTLLHILGTLETPTRGTVRLDGEDPFQMDDSSLARFRNDKIGFVFQEHHLLTQLTVLENVLLPIVAERATTDLDQQRAESLLQRVGLADRLDHRPAELSGGERQRAAIARALIREPLLILADEPTGNLDQRTAAQIGQLLLESVAREGRETILIAVTHSQDLARLFPRRCELSDGMVRDSSAEHQIATDERPT